MGFEYFYGFVGGDANQWQPNLFRNTTQIYPFQGKPGWNLITGMADDAIDYLNADQPDRPEQAVLHQVRARRHARAASSDQGMGGQDPATMHLFDDGWNKLRETDLREPEEARRDPAGRQADALAQRDVSSTGTTARADEKKLFIRQVEVFAAYAAYNDHEIGRVIQAVRGHGQARQHAHHLHQRRQRHQRRGRPARHAQRSRVLQRRQRCRSRCR